MTFVTSFNMRKRATKAPKSETVISKIDSFQSFDDMTWSKILVKRNELNLSILLKCGQSFRWSQFRASPTEWIGVLSGNLFVLSQNEDELLYKVLPEKTDSETCDKLLNDYFQLKVFLTHNLHIKRHVLIEY